MCVAGGCHLKEMEVGVKDVNWRLVGAWTTGSAMKKNIMLDHLIACVFVCSCGISPVLQLHVISIWFLRPDLKEYSTDLAVHSYNIVGGGKVKKKIKKMK